jgi:hypothetical protein
MPRAPPALCTHCLSARRRLLRAGRSANPMRGHQYAKPPKPLRVARARRPGRLARFASVIRAGATRAGRLLTGGRKPAIAVLLTDKARRRALERELRTQLENLRRALGADLPLDAIVVHQVLLDPGGDHERAGCTRATTRADGRKRTLMVLAMQACGRQFTIDEVLAALAVQALALLWSVPRPPNELV